MKKQQSIPLVMPAIIMVFIIYLTFSCSGRDTDSTDKQTDMQLIVELNSSQFPNVSKDSIEKETYNNLQQLDGVEFFLKPENNYLDEITLQTNGKEKELTLQQLTQNNNAQLFYFKFSPVSINTPYMIYSAKEKTPIGIGSYKNTPNQYVLFNQASGKTSLFGFGWNLTLNTDRNKYFIESRDITSSSGVSILNYVVDTQNKELSIEKKNNTASQQFNIVPNDEFLIEDIKISTKGGEITESKPIILKRGTVKNDTSQEVKQNLALSETRIDANSFIERMGGILITKTGNLEIETELPKVIISNGVTSFGNNEITKLKYSTNSPLTTTIQLNIDNTISPKTTLNYKITVIQYQFRLKYTVRCRGVKSGKIINISGVYNGTSYSNPSLEKTIQKI
ncbi:hypothetical protein [Elizabethkingia anophelis]|uniref:hypothetical protein n=1 Tax=Elizabethkingia anophelis TaxID=1117645 RepID=UPI0038923773|nr:hypothetical protein [Elizabethkingia anophelis]